MARRVSWTNNSSGHLGSYVYRAETLDPQALPEPVGQVGPVAQGATAEWVDSDELLAGDYDYAVQDFNDQGMGQVSAVEAHTIPLSAPDIGDEWEGGIYAGTITYPDAREFHIIFAKLEGVLQPGDGSTLWRDGGNPRVADEFDGAANTQAMLADSPAAQHCMSYAGGGFTDWYLPARNEIAMVNNIGDHPEIGNLDAFPNVGRWSSTESAVSNAYNHTSPYTFEGDYVPGEESVLSKDSTNRRVCPVRRVAV